MLENIIDTKNLNSSVEHIRSGVAEAVTAVEGNARELLSKSGEVVKKNPIYALMGAAAVGFVAGSFLRDYLKNTKR